MHLTTDVIIDTVLRGGSKCIIMHLTTDVTIDTVLRGGSKCMATPFCHLLVLKKEWINSSAQDSYIVP